MISVRKTGYAEQDIARDIENSIVENKLAVGCRLDTTAQLARRYLVSEKTIHRAISRLVERKLLYRVRGSGTYVRNNISFVDRLNIAVFVARPSGDMLSDFFTAAFESENILISGLRALGHRAEMIMTDDIDYEMKRLELERHDVIVASAGFVKSSGQLCGFPEEHLHYYAGDPGGMNIYALAGQDCAKHFLTGFSRNDGIISLSDLITVGMHDEFSHGGVDMRKVKLISYDKMQRFFSGKSAAAPVAFDRPPVPDHGRTDDPHGRGGLPPQRPGLPDLRRTGDRVGARTRRLNTAAENHTYPCCPARWAGRKQNGHHRRSDRLEKPLRSDH